MSSFALVSLGSKQFKAVVGESFITDGSASDLDLMPVGKIVEFSNVVAYSPDGSALIVDSNKLSKCTVSCKVVSTYRDDKVTVFKKKRRKGYVRKRGHRQYQRILVVDSIKI